MTALKLNGSAHCGAGFVDATRAAGLAVVAVAILAAACDRGPLLLGEPFDVGQARTLAEHMRLPPAAQVGPVTISGRVAQVCQSAGCWLVLQEVTDRELFQLTIDLQGAAFTVPRDAAGRDAVVQGRVVGAAPDLKMRATSVLLR